MAKGLADDHRQPDRQELRIPPSWGAITCQDLRQIKASADDFGLMSYDRAFTNTASCRSAITSSTARRASCATAAIPSSSWRSRGPSSSRLSDRQGELPTASRLKEFVHNITTHTILHENIKLFIDGFHYDAHPMGILVSAVGALSTFYPDAKKIFDAESRSADASVDRQMPDAGGVRYRHSIGMPTPIRQRPQLPGNFLNMMFKKTELKYKPNPVLERALATCSHLHAITSRTAAPTHAQRRQLAGRPRSRGWLRRRRRCMGRCTAGQRTSHQMLREIGDVKNVPGYINASEAGEIRLQGFGHRIYKKLLSARQGDQADRRRGVRGDRPQSLLDIALELERIALADDYFISHRLYPNVDFYSGIIYLAMGFSDGHVFPGAVRHRAAPGWLAQWQEMLLDPETRIAHAQPISRHALSPLRPPSRDGAISGLSARPESHSWTVHARSPDRATSPATAPASRGSARWRTARETCPSESHRQIDDARIKSTLGYSRWRNEVVVRHAMRSSSSAMSSRGLRRSPRTPRRPICLITLARGS